MRLIKTIMGGKLSPNYDYLFLGKWCISKDNKIQGKKRNILPYHWDDRDEYYKSFIYLDDLYESRLEKYSNVLNEMHGVDNSTRYWRIIIGPWLGSFINVLYDRFLSINNAIKSGKVTDVEIFEYNTNNWVPKNFEEYYNYILNDSFNDILYSEIIKLTNIPYTTNNKIFLNNSIKIKTINKSIIKKIIDFSQIFVPSYFQKIVLFSVYAPLKNRMKLHYKLRQIPYYGLEILPKNVEINSISRNKFSVNSQLGEFERLLNVLIPMFIPTVYVENFSYVKLKSLQKFPKQTNVILTSTGYEGNDAFSIWAAERVENYKSKLYIDQHGGGTGLYLWDWDEGHINKISDKFFSWGWVDFRYKNVQPMPSIKISEYNISQNNMGDILYVMSSLPPYFYRHMSLPVAGQYSVYFKQQISFFDKVNEKVLKNLKIRSDSRFDKNINEKIKISGYGEYIDLDKSTFISRVNCTRICICSSNGSIFLEMMSANFPVIVFWNFNYNELRPAAQKWINQLQVVGIFHDSPQSAAKFLNSISHNVSKWWLSDKVQNIRSEFVENYALNSPDWCDKWHKELIK